MLSPDSLHTLDSIPAVPNTTAVYSVSNQPPLLFQMEYPTPVVARCNPSRHCPIAKALTPLKKLVRNAVSYIQA